jgi:hypothetical protein
MAKNVTGRDVSAPPADVVAASFAAIELLIAAGHAEWVPGTNKQRFIMKDGGKVLEVGPQGIVCIGVSDEL